MNRSDTDGRRLLEPAYTAGYVHIPHLRKKLKLLYGYHPLIDAQYKLARTLGIAPATLATWLNGTQVRDGRTVAPLNPDSIPARRFPKFLDVWGLPQAVLEIDDFAAFKSALVTIEAGRSAWEKLVRAIADDDRIEIIANRHRGLIDPDDAEDPSFLRFERNDEILISVANPGLKHGLMLLQDRFGWSCLHPNLRSEETAVGDVLVFPHQIDNAAPRFARFDAVGGIHRILAIFLAEPPPAGVLEILLMRPIDSGSLNHTAPVLQNLVATGPDRCRMFSRRFLVLPA